MAMQESTTRSGLKSLNRSLKTPQTSSQMPRFDFNAADDEGERQADSPLHKAMVKRVLKMIQAEERG